MVEISLEDNEPKMKVQKTLLDRTLTIGKVIEIGSWSGTKQKLLKDKTTKEVKSEKVYLNVLVGEAIVSCWMNADIKKGSEPAYNTLSYTNLENLGLVKDFKEQVLAAANASTIVDLKSIEVYFRNKLQDKNIKFVPETITPKEGAKYSVIQTIEGFA
jgi:hypothetical protein